MKKVFSNGPILAFATLISVCSPLLAAAQTGGNRLGNINDVTAKFTNLGNTFIQVLIVFSVIWIIFNVVRFLIVGADSEDKRKSARQAIIWGVVGLAIILSIWGLVNIVLNTFKFTDNNAPSTQFPTVPTSNGSGNTSGVNWNNTINGGSGGGTSSYIDASGSHTQTQCDKYSGAC